MHREAWRALCAKLETVGYAAMSPSERVWLNARWFIDAVEGGGCLSYFYNSGANHLSDCRDALRVLGADAHLHELDRISNLFGRFVPHDIDDRNDIIDGWPEGQHDALLDEVDNRLMPLMDELETTLAAYVEPTLRQSNPSLERP